MSKTNEETQRDMDEAVNCCMAALPENLTRRRQVLQGLLKILPMNFPRRKRIFEALTYLNQHEKAQLEFSLSHQHDGHDGGGR